MEDRPISIRLGVRRMEALERYLADHDSETRNGVIAGAVEAYLRETGYWDGPTRSVSADTGRMATRRPTLSERVAALEEALAELRKEMSDTEA